MPGGRQRSAHPVLVLLLIAGLAVGGGLAAVLADADPAVDAPWWAVAVLAATLIAAGLLHVNVRHGDEVDAVDMFEAALAPVIFALSGPLAVALASVAKAVAESALRIPLTKAAFNTAQWTAAAGAGALVLAVLAPAERSAADLPALAVALVVVAVVNQAAFVTVLRLAQGAPLGGVLASLRPMLVPAWVVGGGVNLALGLLFAAAFTLSPGTAPLFIVALAALHIGGRGYATTLADRARLRGLQRATHVLSASGQPEQAIPRFLAEVRACFGAIGAELLVADEHGPQVLYRRVGDTTEMISPAPPGTIGVLVMRRGEPLRVSVDDDDTQVASLLRDQARRDVLAAPVTRDGDVAAALCVYDREGLVGEVGAELAVLDALAGEVGQALGRWQLHAALGRSEERFRRLVQRSSDIVTVVDAGDVVRYVSPAVWRVLGVADDDCLDQALARLVHPDDWHTVNAALHQARAGGAPVSVRHRGRAADGSWRPLDTVVSDLRDETQLGALVLNSRDATDRRRLEQFLMKQAQVLEAIASDAPLNEVLDHVVDHIETSCPDARAAVVVTHDHRHVTVDPAPEVTDALLSALEDPDAVWPGSSSRPAAGELVVLADVERDPVTRRLQCAARAARIRALWALWRSSDEDFDGGLVVYHGTARTPGSAERRVIEQAAHLVRIGVQRIRSRERLVQQATRDPLTGLPNRALFLDRARLALARIGRRHTTVAILFVDLDRFKIVNDSLGHDAGDRLLIAIGRRLTQMTRPHDTVARFGGDEFTILCEELDDLSEAVEIAERVNRVLTEPVLIDGRELFVTASVGVAAASAPDVLPEGLLENADAAMYRAKIGGGRRSVVFHEGMRTAAQSRLATHSALHRGVEREEFCVFYQPIVSLASGRVVGAEALVRWRHPDRGLLAPARFIDSAEDTGLIVPIGKHVLRQACEQALVWREQCQEDFTISVNLSARQLADAELVDLLTELVATAGFDPHCLTLEITESTFMEDAATMTATLHLFRDLGVRLAIDDFGTGYSSLSYLSRFPLDGLKVDRSFVSGLGSDPSDTAIVAAIIRLADTLSLSATAEGVEDPGQVAILRDLGCQAAQGYLFSPPVPAVELDLTAVQAH